jgi:hypothetical protein
VEGDVPAGRARETVVRNCSPGKMVGGPIVQGYWEICGKVVKVFHDLARVIVLRCATGAAGGSAP